MQCFKDKSKMHQHFALSVFIQLRVVENSIAFTPKYRRMVIYNETKADILFLFVTHHCNTYTTSGLFDGLALN